MYINEAIYINTEKFYAMTQNNGDEFNSPILSMLDVILRINATKSINLAPLSLTSALNGAKMSQSIS